MVDDPSGHHEVGSTANGGRHGSVRYSLLLLSSAATLRCFIAGDALFEHTHQFLLVLLFRYLERPTRCLERVSQAANLRVDRSQRTANRWVARGGHRPL